MSQSVHLCSRENERERWVGWGVRRQWGVVREGGRQVYVYFISQTLFETGDSALRKTDKGTGKRRCVHERGPCKSEKDQEVCKEK